MSWLLVTTGLRTWGGDLETLVRKEFLDAVEFEKNLKGWGLQYRMH